VDRISEWHVHVVWYFIEALNYYHHWKCGVILTNQVVKCLSACLALRSVLQLTVCCRRRTSAQRFQKVFQHFTDYFVPMKVSHRSFVISIYFFFSLCHYHLICTALWDGIFVRSLARRFQLHMQKIIRLPHGICFRSLALKHFSIEFNYLLISMYGLNSYWFHFTENVIFAISNIRRTFWTAIEYSRLLIDELFQLQFHKIFRGYFDFFSW